MPILHPASVQGMDLGGVWSIFFGAGVFVAAFVYVLIAYAIIRWRRRGRERGLPPQFANNTPLEITGAVIPILLVVGLFAITYARELGVDYAKPGPYAVVDVTAYRWNWQFRYPQHGIIINGNADAPPVLMLPEGKMTEINLYSSDVVHSFWIPAFLFKRDATPGYTIHFDVTPSRTGDYLGECSEYCGLDHALMRFRVRVVPAPQFDRWLASGGNAPA